MLKVVTTVGAEDKVVSKVHKSLAEILGIKKRGEPVEQPKVAVVIDPKIAKILRPHQIEGVKVFSPPRYNPFSDKVSLSGYDRENSRWRFWMYHGR